MRVHVGAGQHSLGRLLYGRSWGAWLLRWAVIAGAVGLGLLIAYQMVLTSMRPEVIYRKDFIQEYVTAKAVSVGDDPYQPVNLLAQRYSGADTWFVNPSPHPPPTVVLFLPLAYLRYPTAVAVWLVLQACFLVAAVYLLARPSGRWPRLWAVAGVAASSPIWYPVLDDLRWGQLNMLLLLLLAGARLALLSGRSGWGGALVGLSVLVKLFTWPLLVLFLLRRDWRALGWAVSTVTLGYLVSGWVIGFGRIVDYFAGVLPEVGRSFQGSIFNLSAWSLGLRLFTGTGELFHSRLVAPPLVESPMAAAVVSAGLPALVLLIGCWIGWRQKSLDPALGVMVCASILVSPLAWAHYEVLLLVPVAYVVGWLVSHRLPSAETNAGLVVAMLLLLSVDQWGLLAVALAGRSLDEGPSLVLPFGPALLTLGPSAVIAALGWLMLWLGGREELTQSH